MESLEQEFMAMLRRLPTPIVITWRSGLYHWQCAQETGSSHRLATTVEDALRYLLSSSNSNASFPEQTNKLTNSGTDG